MVSFSLPLCLAGGPLKNPCDGSPEDLGQQSMSGERSRLTQDPLLFTVEEQAEIRSGFLAARTQLPVMVIVTPQDRKNSVWTQDGPSPQVQSYSYLQICVFLPPWKK